MILFRSRFNLSLDTPIYSRLMTVSYRIIMMYCRLRSSLWKLKTIVFLNLGSLTSILPIFYPPTTREELHSEPRPDLTFFIIDNHRPWDLNNVFLQEGNVFCVDDGDIE